MKSVHQISKLALVGVLSLGSLVALAACGNNSGTDTSQNQTTESPTAATTPTSTVSPVVATSETTAAPEATTSPAATSEAATPKNIVEVAAANESFTTLEKAIAAAGLTETLSGQGPYTVFAPTDEAFAALPSGTLDNLLKPENKDLLVKVLTYHVVPEKVTSNNITAGEVKTVEGDAVTVKVDTATKTVKVNEAKVTQPDIEASNGVIHVVDKVIIPADVQEKLESSSKTN